MTPSQLFTEFGTGNDNDFAGTGDRVATGTIGGVTFTVSAPTSATSWSMILGDNITVGNSGTAATQTFTITWTDGSGGNSASSVLVTGAAISKLFYETTGGLVSATPNVAFAGQISSLKFILSGFADLATLGSLSLSINCFTPGTRIATPDGARTVETLQTDDLVLTTDGRAVPVTWLGKQTIDARTVHPEKVNPIRITAGALGYGMPERDLCLSPDHAVEIDGTLFNAGTLVNETTIYQEDGVLPEGFTYYHIETETHELLLAEGVAAESFVDYAGRDAFDNGDELRGPIPEMDLPRVSSKRMVPDHIRARLAPKIAAE